MKRSRPSETGRLSTAQKSGGFEAKILRLVKSAPECQAIQSGEIDAIIDPTNGHVILLPEAQAAVLERKARFRSLVELSTDGYWEQDQRYRFVLHTGAVIGNAQSNGAGILGKTLWNLPFDRGNEVDWQTHRTQLAWRAIFRDLELRCVDAQGGLRLISISGEPLFETDGQFKGYRGITRDITDRGLSQTAAPTADHFARTLLDTLVTQICVLDATGTIIESNTAWRVLAATHRGHEADVSKGSNYLALCDRIAGAERVDAIAMAAGIRQVLAGERELFRYEYFCDALEQRWFMATIMRIHGDDAARAIVSYEDITAIKHAEQLLRLECAVARCLAEADNSTVALQAVIQAVCETQHWDCGQYFRFDPATEQLVHEASWGKSTAVVAQFMKKSHGATLRSGAGLVGRAYQSGEPLWIQGKSNNACIWALAHEISVDTHDKKTEANTGAEPNLEGSFVFPVIAENKVIGVLAFASCIVPQPDDRLLRAVRSVGNQLGRFLLRQQSMDALRRSELRFRRLTELSSDWVWEQDNDFRFTKIAGTSMSGAGNMVGKTLWELPIVLSDEEWIKHKSELQARWSFCDFEFAMLLADGQRHYYRISGEPLYDTAGAFIGFHGTGLDITHSRRREITLSDVDAHPDGLSA